MRWPFGPPHLTLKPSKKNKKTKKKKNEPQKTKINKTTTSNHKTKHKANKTETKATQRRKANTRNTKTPKPSKPRWTTMSHPRKKLKTGKKQAFLSLFKQCQTHQKQTFFNSKTSKRQTQKTPFCHVQKQPTIFHQFSVFFFFFSTYSFLFLKSCVCWKHYKNSVFKKHSFSKTQLVKPTFSTMAKKHLFQKKVSFLFFCNFRWNPYFYSVSCFALFWSKKEFWPKQIVCTKMRAGNFC